MYTESQDSNPERPCRLCPLATLRPTFYHRARCGKSCGLLLCFYGLLHYRTAQLRQSLCPPSWPTSPKMASLMLPLITDILQYGQSKTLFMETLMTLLSYCRDPPIMETQIWQIWLPFSLSSYLVPSFIASKRKYQGVQNYLG